MVPGARAGDEAAQGTEGLDPVERHILQAVRSLEYGSIEIVVHEARVVQVERREKVRFDRRPGEPHDRPAASPLRRSDPPRGIE